MWTSKPGAMASLLLTLQLVCSSLTYAGNSRNSTPWLSAALVLLNELACPYRDIGCLAARLPAKYGECQAACNGQGLMPSKLSCTHASLNGSPHLGPHRHIASGTCRPRTQACINCTRLGMPCQFGRWW
jgi:hypothetical protein